MVEVEVGQSSREGMRQSVSIYQRSSGEKCKQFSWIGFLQSRSPREAVKIESVGEEGREDGGVLGASGGAEGYTCTVTDSSTETSWF